MPQEKYFVCRDFKLDLNKKTYIMGILNATPDSFSDGGRFNTTQKALERAEEMINNGADIIDIGGESTRPGYSEIEESEEIRRVVPIIEVLSNKINVPISIDTMKANVAKAALDAGASIVNDVWGLQKDETMAKVISNYNAGVVMMHNKDEKRYDNLIKEIIEFLDISVKIAVSAGISLSNMVIDPGIGFGKMHEDNIEVLRRLDEFLCIKLPILIGTSRKSIIGNVLHLPVNERIEGTAATVAIGIVNGANFVRVHDVKEMARVAKMADALKR